MVSCSVLFFSPFGTDFGASSSSRVSSVPRSSRAQESPLFGASVPSGSHCSVGMDGEGVFYQLRLPKQMAANWIRRREDSAFSSHSCLSLAQAALSRGAWDGILRDSLGWNSAWRAGC